MEFTCKDCLHYEACKKFCKQITYLERRLFVGKCDLFALKVDYIYAPEKTFDDMFGHPLEKLDELQESIHFTKCKK